MSDPYFDAVDARISACNTCMFKMLAVSSPAPMRFYSDLDDDFQDLDDAFEDCAREPSRCLLRSPSFARSTDDDDLAKTDTRSLSPCRLRRPGRPVSVDLNASSETQARGIQDPVVFGLLSQGAVNSHFFHSSVELAKHRIALLSGTELTTAHARVLFLRHVPEDLTLAAQALLTDAEDHEETQAALNLAKSEHTQPNFGNVLLEAILKRQNRKT